MESVALRETIEYGKNQFADKHTIAAFFTDLDYEPDASKLVAMNSPALNDIHRSTAPSRLNGLRWMAEKRLLKTAQTHCSDEQAIQITRLVERFKSREQVAGYQSTDEVRKTLESITNIIDCSKPGFINKNLRITLALQALSHAGDCKVKGAEYRLFTHAPSKAAAILESIVFNCASRTWDGRDNSIDLDALTAPPGSAEFPPKDGKTSYAVQLLRLALVWR